MWNVQVFFVILVHLSPWSTHLRTRRHWTSLSVVVTKSSLSGVCLSHVCFGLTSYNLSLLFICSSVTVVSWRMKVIPVVNHVLMTPSLSHPFRDGFKRKVWWRCLHSPHTSQGDPSPLYPEEVPTSRYLFIRSQVLTTRPFIECEPRRGPRVSYSHKTDPYCCLWLIDNVRTKQRTYIWVSVWWKTKN
jgi:hypothetical protein